MAAIGQPNFEHPTPSPNLPPPPQKAVQGTGAKASKSKINSRKIHWGIVLSLKLMILEGIRLPMPYIVVCYANNPPKELGGGGGGYMAPALAFDLTTSLRGDFSRTEFHSN